MQAINVTYVLTWSILYQGRIATNIAFAAAFFTKNIPVPSTDKVANYFLKIVPNNGTFGTLMPTTVAVTVGTFKVSTAHLC